ncbi:rod shape-determining protein MreC [Jatrophihabitans sp.]|uniref:rod shape-determining protein MreC n=1 Tax=Jatrophihabitans sp. TaxID=1932789 RepID=UPI0030C6FDCA|nr:rod shape-determining protein MreC [Jatrophihabitans sp.]
MRRLTRRQRVSAIALTVLALCFITLDLGGGSLAGAHDGVRGSLGSLYRGTDTLLGPMRRFVQGVPHAATNESKIRALQQRNAALQATIAQEQADRSTSKELAALKLGSGALGKKVLPARVIAFGPGQGFDWTVTLDVGTASGVKLGMTVTDGHGVVGRVVHADRGTSLVLLAVDPGSGVGARNSRTAALGVATGAGTDGFTFVPLDPHTTIHVGDTINTGPSDGSSYVAGLAVGTVRSVRTSADGTIKATLRPAVAPDTLDLVGVILSGGEAVGTRAPVGTDNSLAAGGSR